MTLLLATNVLSGFPSRNKQLCVHSQIRVVLLEYLSIVE